MLNIIAIADDDSLVGHIEPNAEVDILISLGDLYDVTLQKAIDLNGSPLEPPKPKVAPKKAVDDGLGLGSLTAAAAAPACAKKHGTCLLAKPTCHKLSNYRLATVWHFSSSWL